MSNPIRIMLVDDHRLTRESLRMLFECDKKFTVIHESDSGPDAIEQVGHLMPDILLIDINMCPINGFEITQRILARHPSIRIIGLSINNYPSYADKMISLGAKGFITKNSSFDEIASAVEAVHQGEIISVIK